MTLGEVKTILDAQLLSGEELLDHEVHTACGSDLMSDVLTLCCDEMILITGLCNLQTIRTAEMADVDCILFVRGKKATPEMLQLASENNMILLETCHSMYHVAGELYCSGLVPVY